jgi:hypothetical protein
MKMKKVLLVSALVALLAATVMLPGCIRRDLSEKNGPMTTRTYDYTGFTGVDIGSALRLDLSYGENYSISVSAGENVFDHLKVVKVGDTLKIYTEGWSLSWWWGDYNPKVTITMPELTSLVVSGATSTTVSGFKSDRPLELGVSGASNVDMDMETGAVAATISGASDVKGRLVASGTRVNLSGASKLSITGNGGDLNLQASGASTAALRYYTVVNADVILSGASNGSIDVSGKLDVNLSGASDLNYYGEPSLGSTSVTGASDLNHKH